MSIPNTDIAINLDKAVYVAAGLIASNGSSLGWGNFGGQLGYGGGCLRKASCDFIVTGGGGAGGWAGNDWIALGLLEDAPSWRTVVAPSPTAVIWKNNTQGGAAARAAQSVAALDQGSGPGQLILLSSADVVLATLTLNDPAAGLNTTTYSLSLPVSGTFSGTGTVAKALLKDSGGVIIGTPTVGTELVLSTTNAVSGNAVSVSSSDITSSAHEYMMDGRPNAVHSYRHPMFFNDDDVMVRFGTFNVWEVDSGRYYNPQLAYWGTGQYELTRSLCPAAPPASGYDSNTNEEAPWLQHPDTDDVYFITSKAVLKYTRASNAWSTLVTGAGWSRGFAGIDPAHNVIFWCNTETDGDYKTFNLANNTWEATAVSGPEEVAIRAAWRDAATVWDPALGKILLYFKNNNIYTIAYAGFSGSTHNWTVDKLAMTGTSPGTSGGGMYSKFQYVPQLKGVVLKHDAADNAFFIRTS